MLAIIATEIGGLCLILDGIDRAERDREKNDLSWFECLPPPVGVLVATSGEEQMRMLAETDVSTHSVRCTRTRPSRLMARGARQSGRDLHPSVVDLLGPRCGFRCGSDWPSVS